MPNRTRYATARLEERREPKSRAQGGRGWRRQESLEKLTRKEPATTLKKNCTSLQFSFSSFSYLLYNNALGKTETQNCPPPRGSAPGRKPGGGGGAQHHRRTKGRTRNQQRPQCGQVGTRGDGRTEPTTGALGRPYTGTSRVVPMASQRKAPHKEKKKRKKKLHEERSSRH